MEDNKMKLENMKKKHGTKEITCEGQIRNFGTEKIPQRLCIYHSIFRT